jgi:hypothetical protein
MKIAFSAGLNGDRFFSWIEWESLNEDRFFSWAE